jgi:hypothetical protein
MVCERKNTRRFKRVLYEHRTNEEIEETTCPEEKKEKLSWKQLICESTATRFVRLHKKLVHVEAHLARGRIIKKHPSTEEHLFGNIVANAHHHRKVLEHSWYCLRRHGPKPSYQRHHVSTQRRLSEVSHEERRASGLTGNDELLLLEHLLPHGRDSERALEWGLDSAIQADGDTKGSTRGE